jgi:CBS domain-containing protein
MKRWTVADVMARDVVTVPPTALYQEIADQLVRHGISAVPVISESGVVLGVVSEADLIGKLEFTDRMPRHQLTQRRMRQRRGKKVGDTAADLMTSPAITIERNASLAEAARLMDSARVKRLPVTDVAGRLIGLIARRDLVRLYTRPDDDLRAAVARELHELWLDDNPIEVTIDRGVVTIDGTVDRRTTARMVASVAGSTPGIVRVVDRLSYRYDDTKLVEPGLMEFSGTPQIRR